MPPTSKANNVIIGALRCAAVMLVLGCAALLVLGWAAKCSCALSLGMHFVLALCRPLCKSCWPLPPPAARCIYQLATHPFRLSAAGRTWIDTYGDMTLLNSTTGAKAYLYFTPCGWFGAGRYEVRPRPLPSCQSSRNCDASCFRGCPCFLPPPVLTQA